MPLQPLDNPQPYKRPYAIKPATFREDIKGFRKAVDAVWLGRKNGVTTISEGILTLWWAHGDTSSNWDFPIEEAFKHVDHRFGGDAMVRWNGTDLWVNPRVPLSQADQAAAIVRLTSLLQNVGSLPPEYDGWYKLVRCPCVQ